MSTPSTIKNTLLTIEAQIGQHPLEQLLAMVGESKSNNPSNPDADCDRAVLFQALGQHSGAAQAIAEALRMTPAHARALQLQQLLEPYIPPQGEIAEHSMLSKERLESLQHLTNRVLAESIPGDLIECGVAGGGSLSVMAQVLKKHNDPARRCIGLDTFAGMPAPTGRDTAHGIHANDTGWGHGTCSSGGTQRIQSMLESKGLVDRVELIEGLFEDTLPAFRQRMINEGRTIALLHCDADWYSSTKCITDHLWDLMSPGGLIQIDDYGHWDGCRQAIDEALVKINPTPRLHRIDYTGRWLQMPPLSACSIHGT